MDGNKKLPRGISVTRQGRYRVRFSVDGRQVQVGEYDLLSHAKAALDKARGELVTNSFESPVVRRERLHEEEERAHAESMTFAEWFDIWIARLEASGRSPGTIRSYKSHKKSHIPPEWLERRLVDFKPVDFDALLNDLARIPPTGRTKSKRNGIVDHVGRTLRACFSAAVEVGAGGLTVSPFHYKLVDPKSARKRGVSDEEVASTEEIHALAEAMDEEYSLSVYLAAYCSLRIGEVLGLNVGDFENLDKPDEALLHVERQANSKAGGELTAPKWDSRRVIAVPPALCPLIREHIAAYCGDTPGSPLFVNPKSGLRVTHKVLDNRWRLARDAVKPGFSFHNLRHTGLTMYAQQGATLAELMARGGHSDVEVALRYQHATQSRDRQLAAEMKILL